MSQPDDYGLITTAGTKKMTSHYPPWSYSSLTKFETCPKQFFHTKVAKDVKEPPTVHTDWGTEVHTALELRVRDKIPLPEKMLKWEPHAALFDSAPGSVFTEKQYAFTRNLDSSDWWGEDTWCRGIVDVGVVNGRKAVAMDWKTGKPKPASDQMRLFAAFIMQEHLEVEQVSTAFIWLAHDKATKEKVTRAMLPSIWEDFIARSLRLEAAYAKDRWVPKPSGLCREWCPVPKALCGYSGKK